MNQKKEEQIESNSNDIVYEPIDDESAKELIKQYITDDVYLDDEQKEFLSCDQFIDDMLKYDIYNNLNQNTDVFNGLKIDGFDNTNDDYKLAGYYYYGGDTIYINNYNNKSFDEYKDILAHEYIHIYQNNNSKRNYINEALAEILSNEYFDCPIDSYKEYIINTILIMELIGKEPLLNFMFTNDYTDIENELKNYLNEEDLNTTMNILKNHDTEDLNSNDNEILNSILKQVFIDNNKEYLYHLVNNSLSSNDFF